MKTVLYYFTGTGNSLAAARKVAAALGDCELIPFASQRTTVGDIVPQAERVGIVCPVYFTGLPLMVAECLGRMDMTAAEYLFAIVTHGGGGESAALRQIDSILRKREGRGLDAGFGIAMPGNYILLYESPKGKEQAEVLAKADVAIAGITGPVSRCERRELPPALLPRVLHALIYPYFRFHARTGDKKFTVTDACTSCGTCAATCPAENIVMNEGKPVFSHHCELCCGCIHTCPAQAIQAGTKTRDRVRYHNPDVKIADLKTRRAE